MCTVGLGSSCIPLHPATVTDAKEVTVSPVDIIENGSLGHLCCVDHSRYTEHVCSKY